MRSKKLFLAFLLIFSCMNMTIPSFADTIRSIRIKIIDSKTKLPLENVLVYYNLEVYWLDTILWVIPILDPVHNKSILQCEYRTNKEGELLIPERKVRLGLYEKIDADKVVINIDIKTEFIDLDTDGRLGAKYLFRAQGKTACGSHGIKGIDLLKG